MSRRKVRVAPYAVTAWTPDEVPATSTRQFFTLQAAAIYTQARFKQAHRASASLTQFAIDNETLYRLHGFTLNDVRKQLGQ